MQFNEDFFINVHYNDFVIVIIFYFNVKNCESQDVERFLLIFYSNVNNIHLIFSRYVKNV